jgi:hypothetical protein
MQRRVTPRLRSAVRDVLLHDWDPIGVCNNAQASNEYDSYVETICRMLVSGADAQKLADHLSQLESVSMGLSFSSRNLPEVANRLLAVVR